MNMYFVCREAAAGTDDWGQESRVRHRFERTHGKEQPTFKISLFLLKNKGTKRQLLSITEMDIYTQ